MNLQRYCVQLVEVVVTLAKRFVGENVWPFSTFAIPIPTPTIPLSRTRLPSAHPRSIPMVGGVGLRSGLYGQLAFTHAGFRYVEGAVIKLSEASVTCDMPMALLRSVLCRAAPAPTIP